MDIGVREIDQWHRQRGFLKVGYHFVIRRDGTLETGRSLDEIGAHAAGFNSTSIGICLVGGIDDDGNPDANFKPEQWRTLTEVLARLYALHPAATVCGHRDLDPKKACPSFDVAAWLNTGIVKP